MSVTVTSGPYDTDPAGTVRPIVAQQRSWGPATTSFFNRGFIGPFPQTVVGFPLHVEGYSWLTVYHRAWTPVGGVGLYFWEARVFDLDGVTVLADVRWDPTLYLVNLVAPGAWIGVDVPPVGGVVGAPAGRVWRQMALRVTMSQLVAPFGPLVDMQVRGRRGARDDS